MLEEREEAGGLQGGFSTCEPRNVPFAKHADEGFVGAAVENADDRMAEFYRHPESAEDEGDGEIAIDPAIERPLARPNEGPMPAEWSEIKDGPDVGAIGPTRADEVAKQVQMKNQKGEDEYASTLTRESGENS